jgi:hypothetical protein
LDHLTKREDTLMKRRDFLAASCVAGLGPLAAGAMAEAAEAGTVRELYELRLYRIKSPEKQAVVEQFLAKAAVPAWNRLGIEPVGVFRFQEESPDLYVLLPHKSPRTLLTEAARLMADRQFVKAGAPVLEAPVSDPAYERIESSLLLAFEQAPGLERPSEKDTRVFQLRTYESANLLKARKKIEMFNRGGEIDIFRRVGMNPVFFGQALVGNKMPNLTYMLGFDDADALEKGWAAFRDDPAWLKLKADPQYADTVSNITNILLRPAACSQV